MYTRIPKAVDSLQRILNETLQGGERFLPGVRDLSRRTGFSHVSVYRGLKYLESRNLISIKSRRGILICGNAPGTSVNPPNVGTLPGTHVPGLSWQRLHWMMVDKIDECAWSPGEQLPQIKTLCLTYHAGHESVRRALLELTHEGRIERFCRGYRVTPVDVRVSGLKLKILFCSFSGEFDYVVNCSTHSSAYWSELDRQCHNHHIHLSLHSFAELLGERITADGVIVSTIAPSQQHLAQIASLLRGCGKPVAVLEESTGAVFRDLCKRNPLIRVFPLGTTPVAGIHVAKKLLAAGHRRALYFSMNKQTGTDWRFDGLQQEFDTWGGNITRCVPHHNRTSEDAMNASSSFQALLAMIGKGMEKFAAEQKVPYDDSTMKRFAWDWARKAMLPADMQTEFEKALQRKEVTAWVCYSDAIGIAAMRFLQSRGVRVPQTISVVSFDNTLQARGAGLSSFDFNQQAIVNSILSWLLAASVPARNRGPGGVADEPGELIIRESFAPVQLAGRLLRG